MEIKLKLKYRATGNSKRVAYKHRTGSKLHRRPVRQMPKRPWS